MNTHILKPGTLTLSEVKQILNHDTETSLALTPEAIADIHRASKLIDKIIASNKTVYGINTGFGALAHTKIPKNELNNLQKYIVLSHAAGTGVYISDRASQLMLLLKINSLARGYSGVHLATIDALIKLFNAQIYPCIPAQGSVGASGDLAPLAHMSAILLGEGEARHANNRLSATEALKKINIAPLQFAAKEGLALLNGTQFSTALALETLIKLENIFSAALLSGALSTEAVRASHTPFDAKIQAVRGHAGQEKVAAWLRNLLAGSEINASHEDCEKVQDPYSFRCQPQVMGAIYTQIEYAAKQIMIEANAASDNPLVFAEQDEVLSGGNFHAEPIAFAADALAVAIAEIGSLSERRIAVLIDGKFSGLPPFLTENPGVNSGFMLGQVTAAALVSENKSLAHPASVDSIPTSANQEDHVSMSAYAARRLELMLNNLTAIIAIEFLAAAQGLDFLQPLQPSVPLQQVYQLIRKEVAFYNDDRILAKDIAKVIKIIQSGQMEKWLSVSFA